MAVFLSVVFSLLLLGLPSAHAQGTSPYCQSSFVTDIGPGMTDSAGNWQLFYGDCSANYSCDHYFDLSIPAGATFDVSLCTNGGSATWDTTLGVYVG